MTGLFTLRVVQGQEFTEQYMVEYQREHNGRWFRFHNRRGHEVSHRTVLFLPGLYPGIF